MSTGFGKARNASYMMSDLVQVKRDIKLLYALGRTVPSPNQTVLPFVTGIHPASAPSGYLGLNVQGASMIGPIAFLPINNVFITTGNVLDISKSGGAFSTIVSLQAGFQTVKTILGATNDGQLLFLRGGGGTTTIVNTGNVFPMNQEATYTWNGNDTVIFLYNANIAKWMQITGPLATESANRNLSNLLAPTAVNVDLLPASSAVQSLGSISVPWLTINGFNYRIIGDDVTRFTLSKIRVSGSSAFVDNNYQDIVHTNIGFDWSINNNVIFQIVHNTSSDPVDFVFVTDPIVISGGDTNTYLQFDSMDHSPSNPVSRKVRLYALKSGAGDSLVVKWADGTVTVLASH